MGPGNWTRKEVGGKVKGLKVGAIGDEWKDGVVKGKVGEGKLVVVTIIAGGARFSFSLP